MKTKQNTRSKSILAITFATVSMASTALGDVQTSTEWSDRFGDNNIDPFVRLFPTDGHDMKGVSKRIKTKFFASKYVNNRATRGVEAAANLPVQEKGEWQFKFYLPRAGDGVSGNQRYPDNAIGAIGQLFQNQVNNNLTGSHACIINVDHNDLYVEYRSSFHPTNTTTSVLVDDTITRNVWHTIQLRFETSKNGTGYFRVKYDGKVIAEHENINFGWGEWSGDSQTGGSFITGVFGQYNHNDSFYAGSNQQWTAYYDSCKWRNKD